MASQAWHRGDRDSVSQGWGAREFRAAHTAKADRVRSRTTRNDGCGRLGVVRGWAGAFVVGFVVHTDCATVVNMAHSSEFELGSLAVSWMVGGKASGAPGRGRGPSFREFFLQE